MHVLKWPSQPNEYIDMSKGTLDEYSLDSKEDTPKQENIGNHYPLAIAYSKKHLGRVNTRKYLGWMKRNKIIVGREKKCCLGLHLVEDSVSLSQRSFYGYVGFLFHL